MTPIRMICSRVLSTLAHGIFPDGSVVIENDRIIDFGTISEMSKSYPSVEKLDFSDCVVMPSLVNAHTHVSLSDMAGKVSGDTFDKWLLNLIKLRRGRKIEDNKSSTLDGFRQLLRNGITTIGDSNPDLIPFDLALLGNFRGVYYFEVFGISDAIQSWKIYKYRTQLNRAFKKQNTKVRLGISPHTPFTATPPVFRFASNYSIRRNIPVSIHLGESKFEMEFMKSRDSAPRKIMGAPSRRIPVVDGSLAAYVDSYGIINAKTIFAHGCYLTDADFKLIGKRKGSLVSCPSSNRNVGSDFLDITRPISAGVNVCIGSDSPASSDGYDLFHELRLALRVGQENHLAINADDALAMITSNPAKLLGFRKEIGSIEKGRFADLIAIKPSADFNFDSDNVNEEILLKVKGKDVVMTMSNGEVRYSSIDSIPIENPIEK